MRMEKILIHTLGCKVNYADMQSLSRELAQLVDVPAALVGTCCVTAEGEKQSRKEVRRALRRVGPDGKVFVAGCAARLHPDDFAGMGKNVEVLQPGTGSGAALIPKPGGETRAAAVDREQADGLLHGPETTDNETISGDRTRFFLKVQDGCANMCSYCVLPQVRGRPRSIRSGVVIDSARKAVASGYSELVVTGINTGGYRDGDFDLAALMDELSVLEGLNRLRLSSVEAIHVSDSLLEVMSRREVIGRHLHLPLQSGDDGVLKAMGRRYDTSSFAAVVERARNAVPGINLTTDVITGFPAEDEQAFENTVDFIKNMGFSKVHVFSYSPRPGTKAEELGDPVPAQEKRRRAGKLRELSDRLQDEHRQRKLGRVDEILLESARRPGVHAGYSSDYTRYVAEGGKPGDMVKVCGELVKTEGIWGKVLGG